MQMPHAEQAKFNDLFGSGKLTGNEAVEEQNQNINLTGKQKGTVQIQESKNINKRSKKHRGKKLAQRHNKLAKKEGTRWGLNEPLSQHPF